MIEQRLGTSSVKIDSTQAGFQFISSLRCEIWCLYNIYGSVSITASWKNVNNRTGSVFLSMPAVAFSSFTLLFLLIGTILTHAHTSGGNAASIYPLSIFKSARLIDGLSNKRRGLQNVQKH